MDSARQLAESLRRLRQDAGLTQPRMAKWLGVSQPTLNRLENAWQNPTLKTLNRLCRALRCRAGELFEPGQLKLRAGHAGKPDIEEPNKLGRWKVPGVNSSSNWTT